jgi:KDO2-lipid IV(A) lauroyltransferase
MFLYTLDRRHRRIVRRNLNFAQPHWSEDRIRKLSRAVFQNIGITVLEVLQMLSFGREDILQRVRLKGEEHLLEAMNGSRGALLISAHLGNWEMSHVFVGCHVQTPVVVVARRLRPMVLHRIMYALRTRFGNVILDKKGAIPEVTRTLRQRRVVGLLIDQGATRSEGVDITFFGRKVSATPAPAILARRHRCPVLPAFCVRESDGGLTLVVEPPLVLQHTKDVRTDIQVNTQLMNDAVERAVRAYPEQWFWVHKRWKRHYPALYPEDLAKRKRDKEKRKRRSQKA